MDTCILTIGGSDSSSGAGIQADIKTAASVGVYAACAITCVTAQNTREFGAVQLVDPGVIEEQIRTVADDLPIAAVKVGMLGSPEAALAATRALQALRSVNPQLPIVVDPVLAATTDREGAKEVVARAISRNLVPMATLITPNLPEATVLANCCQQIMSGSTTADNNIAAAPEHASDEVMAAWSARALVAAGSRAVLVKGGHGSDPQVVRDLLFGKASDLLLSVSSPLVEGDGASASAARVLVGPGDRDAHMSRPIGYTAPRMDGEFHGTGCVLSTAIASYLAMGFELPRAVGEAHGLLHKSLQNPLDLGAGSKLINPFSH